MNEISAEVAIEVWGVLVKHCGASDREVDRDLFVGYATGLADVKEYRFQGALGFGGKVRLNQARWSVDCYPEDANPERVRMIEATNRALAELKDRAVDDPTCQDIDAVLPLVSELTPYQAQVFIEMTDYSAVHDGVFFGWPESVALDAIKQHAKLIEDHNRRHFLPYATAKAIVEIHKPVNASKDTARLDWLEDLIQTGLIEAAFEMDGGVHLTLSKVGYPASVYREKNSLREAIDAAMKEST